MPTHVCAVHMPTHVCAVDMPTHVCAVDMPTHVCAVDMPTHVCGQMSFFQEGRKTQAREKRIKKRKRKKGTSFERLRQH